jgi:hypothetical protein
VLWSGALSGIAAAAWISRIPFDFSRELAEAKRLGIVSLTILNNYPKGQDLLLYALLIALPILCALGPWLLFYRSRRHSLRALLAEPAAVTPLPNGQGRVQAGLMFLICCLATFNINRLYAPGSDWALLGETGEHLAWADCLLNGGTYARDFFCLYGPLWIYPVAWAMKLFGTSIVVFRAYSLGLDLLSLAILITFFQATLRHRALFILACLTTVVIFPNLRFSLGLVPMLILHQYAKKEASLPFLASGAALGVSLLFSQEAGLCATVALAVLLGLTARASGAYRSLPRQGGLVVLGAVITTLPVLASFYQQGALGPFFASLYGYPKLVTLGYAALPFPSITALASMPLSSGAFFPYWMIGIYLFAAITLVVQLFLGHDARPSHLRAAILVFGLLLFRTALGRSDISHFINSGLPAFTLTWLMVDAMSRWTKGESGLPILPRAGRLCMAALLVLSLALVIGNLDRFRNHLTEMVNGFRHLPAKFTRQEMGVRVPEIPRLGIFLDPATATTMRKIKTSLDRLTKARDPVLFFPNEAAYYFLFNRTNPSRYVLSYIAVTTAQRLEMVADLERNQPRYVVYSLDDWRIDSIPENLQVPELVAYLAANYSLAEDLGEVVILRRNDPPSPKGRGPTAN